MQLPLFPLPDVVLLPGLVLPLYVFEPRYRELLARVRANREPFGIPRLLAPAGSASSFTSRVSPVGTVAHLREVVDHEDGTASIVVVGGERFEVVEFDSACSYLSAVVRPWPLPTGDEAVVRALALRLRRAWPGGSPGDCWGGDAPEDPLILASACAAALPLTPAQRDRLLRAESLAARWEMLAGWAPPVRLD